jgi:hypothetical protein
VTDAALLAAGSPGRAAADEPSAHAVFAVLDTRVRVISASVGLLRRWSVVYEAFRARPGPADLTVAVGSRSDTEEPRAGEVAVIVDQTVRLWSGSDELFPPLWVPPLDRWLYLRGVAVGRAGQAVLVLAQEHARRTLLALAAMARGAWPLANGLVPVDPDDLLVGPFPEALRLGREALEQLQVDLAHPGLVPVRMPAGGIEWRAQPELLGARWSPVAAAAAALVFLEPAGANHRPRLQVLRPREALARLTAHLHRMPADFQASMDALVRLSARTPAYRLLPGAPARTAQVLEESLLA